MEEHNNIYLGLEAGSGGQTIISYNRLYKYTYTHENEKTERTKSIHFFCEISKQKNANKDFTTTLNYTRKI